MADSVVCSTVDPLSIVGPLEADEGAPRRHYVFANFALANFALVGPPSYAARVSFPDRASSGVLPSARGGPLQVALGSVRVCRRLFPAELHCLSATESAGQRLKASKAERAVARRGPSNLDPREAW